MVEILLDRQIVGLNEAAMKLQWVRLKADPCRNRYDSAAKVRRSDRWNAGAQQTHRNKRIDLARAVSQRLRIVVNAITRHIDLFR